MDIEKKSNTKTIEYKFRDGQKYNKLKSTTSSRVQRAIVESCGKIRADNPSVHRLQASAIRDLRFLESLYEAAYAFIVRRT